MQPRRKDIVPWLAVTMVFGTCGACLAAGTAAMLPRSYGTGLPLIADGQAACAVIYPAEGEAGRVLAERIAAAVTRLGAGDVPLIPDVEAVPERLGRLRPDLREKPLILLGDLNTNRAFFPSYANYYTICDARYPGGDGYVVRTLVRPFGRAVNYLVVGGSTPAGVARAVDRVTEMMAALKPADRVELPFCLEVKLGGALRSAFAEALRRADANPPFEPPREKGYSKEAQKHFTRNAHMYFYTGRPFFARRARDWILYLLDYSPEPIGTSDYWMEDLAVAWRRVSVSPVFSREECQAIDIRMYETFLDQGRRGWWVQKDASLGIGCRHHTTGMLAWWTFLRVLEEVGEPSTEARAKLAKRRTWCEAYLDGLLRHYWDDQDDYQSADSVQNTASYALQTGQLTWYTSGLARRAAQRLMTQVDNMGWYAGIQGYGDALPGWERFRLDGGLLLGSCAFVYQDGGYLWIMDHFPGLDESWGSLQPARLHTFDPGGRLKRKPPDWLTGLYVSRLTPYRLEKLNEGDFLTTPMMDGFHAFGLKAWPVPAELAFDKLVYRSAPEPTRMYFLLQGMAGTPLSTVDPNTIIRLTDQGKLWLVHNTGRRSLYFKNGVYVTRGVNEEGIPAACELVAHGDFGAVAMACSRLPDYRGTTWTRNLIALKDRFLVAIDQVRIEQPGTYMIGCNWRTPGFAVLDGPAWTSKQDDVTFTLLAADAQGMTSRREFTRDGATRPTILRQNRSLTAQAGHEVVFENLLYTSSSTRPMRCALRRVAPGVVAIRVHDGRGREASYVAAAGDQGIRAAGLETDAAAVLVGPGGAWMVGGGKLTLAGMSLDARDGRCVFTPEQAARAADWLAGVWDRAVIPRAEPKKVPEQAERTLQPVWTHPGPTTQGWRMDGVRFKPIRHVVGQSLLATDWILPLLLAEPRLMGQRGGAEFVLELPEPARVIGIDLYGDAFGETDRPLPPAHLDVELTFTRDGFAADARTRRVRVAREPSYHNLYKGHSYLFERYHLSGFEESASAVRVRVVDASIPQMVLTDVRVQVNEPACPQPVRVRVFDLDADGHDEILSWTADGDVAILDGEGALRWQASCPEGIVSAEAWDLDEDKQREIFVSRTDRQVVVYNLDGSVRWVKDFRNIWRESDQHFFGDGSVVYGMGAWKPAGRPRPELILTGYFSAAKLDPAGRVVKWFRRAGHFTQVRTIPQNLPNAGALVMRSDIPWVGPVPLEWWSIQSGAVGTRVDVPNGPAVFLAVDDYDADGRAEAIVATEQGIGLFGDREPLKRWQHITDAPPTGVGLLPSADGKGFVTVYGREDRSTGARTGTYS